MLEYALLALAPGLFWLWFFRHKDDLEPEPRHLLIGVFILGGLAGLAMLGLRPHLDACLLGLPDAWRSPVDAFGLTAGVEEGLKLAAFIIGIWFHRELDEPLDAIIYAVAAALGFASVENFIYLETYESAAVALERAFTAVLAHVTFTGSLGYFFGLARFARTRGGHYVAAGIAVAVLLHGIYDYLLLLGGGFARAALLLILPLGLILLGLEIRWLRARSPLYHPELGRDERPPH